MDRLVDEVQKPLIGIANWNCRIQMPVEEIKTIWEITKQAEQWHSYIQNMK